MTKETLFGAIGDIDEKYIREAKNSKKNYFVKIGNTEERSMRNSGSKFKKPVVAAASLVLGLCVTGLTAFAVAGKLRGYFVDVKRFDGAVTGTAYEQATDEMEISANYGEEGLVVTVTMKYPEIVPYSTFELFGLEEYKILDEYGKVVFEGTATEMANIAAEVEIFVAPPQMSVGKYKLIVNEMAGSSKADQPLVLRGTWECEFVVEK